MLRARLDKVTKKNQKIQATLNSINDAIKLQLCVKEFNAQAKIPLTLIMPPDASFFATKHGYHKIYL